MSSKNFTYVNGADYGAGEYFVPNDTVSIVTGTRTGSPDGYDAVGAMKFIIVTVVFYSIFGVVCVLLYKIIKRRKQRVDMHQRENIARYLKLERKLKLDGYKMRLMFEARQWRQKYSSDKEQIARTGSIDSKSYDTERALGKLEKRHQLYLYNIREENEISDASNLEHPKYNVSESSYRQVETGDVFLLGSPGEVDYSDNLHNKSHELTEKLLVASPTKEEISSEICTTQSTYRSREALEVEANPKCIQKVLQSK